MTKIYKLVIFFQEKKTLTNKEKLLQKLKTYKKRNAFSEYILEEIKIDELIEL